MVILRRVVPLAMFGAVVASCACLSVSGGTLQVRTDCFGGIEDHTLAFAIAADFGQVKELSPYVPITCEAHDVQECAPVGVGARAPIGDDGKLTGEIAFLCDGRMQVAGLVDPADPDTFFVCVADHAFGDTGIFPMACTYMDLEQKPKSGPGGESCVGIAVYKEEANTEDLL